MSSISIQVLTGEHEQRITNDKDNYFMNLGINTRLGALVLNGVLRHLYESRPYRARSAYGDSRKGGGLFCKCAGRITINDCDEVGLYFDNKWEVGKYIRVTNGEHTPETIRLIKTKLADGLKKMWQAKSRSGNGENQGPYMKIDKRGPGTTSLSTYGHDDYIIPLTDEELQELKQNRGYNSYEPKVVISEAQYRCLYEMLKGRDTNKTIKNYGQEAYNSIIGYRTNDQFVISAMEVIKAEMKKVTEEYAQKIKASDDDYENQLRDLRQKAANAHAALQAERDAKYDELRGQLKELSRMGQMGVSAEAAD